MLSDEILLKIAVVFAIIFGVLFIRFVFRKTVLRFLENYSAKSSSRFDELFLSKIKSPIDFLFIVFGFMIAVNVLGLPAHLAVIADGIVRSLLIFTFFWGLFSVIDPLIVFVFGISTKNDNSFSQTLAKLFTKIIKFVTFSLACVMVLQEWGYNVTGFVASLGIVGMAFALAAKDTTANLFGSMVVFSDKPFVIGDLIRVNDSEGFVEDISIRSTKIRRLDQALITMPNSALTNSPIINYTRMGKREISIKIGLTYSTEPSQMVALLDDIRKYLKSNNDVHNEIIYVNFTDFNDSSLGITCYFYTVATEFGEYLSVREKINLEIMQIIKSNNCSFAFPTRTVFLEK